MKNKLNIDPPSKDPIVAKIDELAAQGKSYNEIIKGIDTMLQQKDKVQALSGATFGTPIQPKNKQEAEYSNLRYQQYGGYLTKKQLGGMLLNIGFDVFQNQIQKNMQQAQMSQALQNHFNSVQTNLNPYGLKYGGKISGSKDNFEYGGNMPHSKGGIKVNQDGLPSTKPVAEVESDEVTVKLEGQSYVFSKTLKL